MDEPRETPRPIDYLTSPDFSRQKRFVRYRGLPSLVLSSCGALGTLLIMLISAPGAYVDPFAWIILLPLGAITILFGLAALIALVSSARQPRPAWSDLQGVALIVHLLFWFLFVLAIVLLLHLK